MYRVGFEPTTSASLAAISTSYPEVQQLWMENCTVQIPPTPLFFACSVALTVKRSLEVASQGSKNMIEGFGLGLSLAEEIEKYLA
jgi:hypothetical protein